MAMTVAEVREWLAGLPADARIGIDEDGMSLEVDNGPDTSVLSWLECGTRLSSEEVAS